MWLVMVGHVIARAADLPPGSRMLVRLGERDIVVFNVRGELFALSGKCPHRGANLSLGTLTGVVSSSAPGIYAYSRPGEILRCPWHGWEFDVRTGLSWCDPKRLRLVRYGVSIEPGTKLIGAAYVAEQCRVREEEDYVVVETK
jgi:nitrite reductase/ring-hydroxylating ferredoxin subunit